MAALVDNLMDFARGRLGGGIVLNFTSEPLEPVLRQVIDEVQNIHPERTILDVSSTPEQTIFTFFMPL